MQNKRPTHYIYKWILIPFFQIHHTPAFYDILTLAPASCFVFFFENPVFFELRENNLSLTGHFDSTVTMSFHSYIFHFNINTKPFVHSLYNLVIGSSLIWSFLSTLGHYWTFHRINFHLRLLQQQELLLLSITCRVSCVKKSLTKYTLAHQFYSEGAGTIIILLKDEETKI